MNLFMYYLKSKVTIQYIDLLFLYPYALFLKCLIDDF